MKAILVEQPRVCWLIGVCVDGQDGVYYRTQNAAWSQWVEATRSLLYLLATLATWFSFCCQTTVNVVSGRCQSRVSFLIPWCHSTFDSCDFLKTIKSMTSVFDHNKQTFWGLVASISREKVFHQTSNKYYSQSWSAWRSCSPLHRDPVPPP